MLINHSFGFPVWEGMTTPVRIQQRIRQLEGQGLNHTRIARELGVSRTTVIKYVSRDYSPSPREGAVGTRSLVTGEYARAADEWLTSDLRMPRKQRHTARRVHERLVAELGFPGEYSSVQRWVKKWREAHRRDSDGYAELEWAPGTAQVDYGLAKAVVAGVERTVHYLAVSFPYPDHAVRGRAARGDHGVRVPWSAAGLRTHGHGAQGAGVRTTPPASAIATRTARSRRPACSPCSARITGAGTRFCNPYAGHEKGSVENAVGFVRRNLMVPEPSAEGWDALSRAWLDECDAIARREHYRQAAPIRDLFETDLDHMLPLPGTPFDACDWRSVKTDRTGTVLIDGNRYLAGPRWRSMRLRAGVRALDIEMRGPDGEYIVTLERVWGHEPRTVMEPATLLAIIARKPRMWGESPIRGDFPENVRDLLDRMDGRARADLVDDIRHVSSTSGFAAAAKAVSAIIDAGRRLDRASIDQTARRIRQGGEDTAPGPDLSRYNTYMEERDDD